MILNRSGAGFFGVCRRLFSALLAALILAAALPSFAESTPRAPCFGDGLRASGGHNIGAFIRWALTHVDPSSVPDGATLALPAGQCGTEPWQYLYGGIRTKTDETTLRNFYLNNYTSQMTEDQYAFLTANWDRSGYAADCQGLLDAWLTYEQGEPTDINVQMNYYYWCTQKGPISAIDRPYRIGEALFVQSESTGSMVHIGWICGFDADGEPLAVESRGIPYGVVITKVRHRLWTHRGLMTAVFSYPAAGALERLESTALPPIADDIFYKSTEKAELSALASAPVASGFAGGSGTRDDPWLIANAAQLNYLAALVNAGNTCSGRYFLLTADIELNPTADWERWPFGVKPANEWTPIGYWNSHTDNTPFRGNFSGGGHRISGLFYDRYNKSFVGLFGYAAGGQDCAISDLTVEMAFIHGLNNVGGIVGCAKGGVRIENCSFGGYIYSEYWQGGVLGYGSADGSAPSLRGCVNLAELDGTYAVGGLAGGGADGISIEASFNAGPIDSSDAAGGLLGLGCGAELTNCYNSGLVEGNLSVGGLIGRAESCTVSSCYSAGGLVAQEGGGGAIGSTGGESSVENCYYLNAASIPVSEYGAPRTAAQLSAFGGYPGFDFASVWTIRESTGYPYAQLIGNAHRSGGYPRANAGDIDGDGSITAADAMLALRFSMRLIELTGARIIRGDIDGDGWLTPSDAVLILRLSMHLI